MARRCFYSFHYEPDNWRASTVRQIGAIEGNQPARDNDWESIAHGPNHDEKWNDGLGVVGIRIHGLKNRLGETSAAGDNPFDHIKHGPTQKPLSSLVKCYSPGGSTSQERYAWIAEHLSNAVEEAIRIRNANS